MEFKEGLSWPALPPKRGPWLRMPEHYYAMSMQALSLPQILMAGRAEGKWSGHEQQLYINYL